MLRITTSKGEEFQLGMRAIFYVEDPRRLEMSDGELNRNKQFRQKS